MQEIKKRLRIFAGLKLHINEEDFPNWFKEFVLKHFI